MKILIILRGLPGSGKSTLVKHLEKEYGVTATVCSADHFFYFGKEHVPENYKYDMGLIGKAHQSCKNTFESAVNDNHELICIDNTNIKLRDIKPYIVYGCENGYEVISHAITNMKAEESFKLNVHKVPLNVCTKMLSAYNRLPKNILSNDKVYEVKEFKHNYLKLRQGVLNTGSF